MRNIALTVAALTLSAPALAGISSGNADLHGWAVEDQRLQYVQKRDIREVKSPFDNPDQYAGVLADETPAYRDLPPAPGVGDSYGSVLHDVGVHH